MVASTPARGRVAPVAVLAVTLIVFGLAVAYVTFWLRSGLREQVLRREADALAEVASLQLANEAEALAKLGVTDAPGELLNAVLKTSKLRGVFAVRVFDAEQRFSGAVPLPWSETPPAGEEWRALLAGTPVVRLHPREFAAEIIGLAPPDTGSAGEPLLETWLPLRSAGQVELAGAAQLWTDGRTIAAEFASLDRRLMTQAFLAWGAGSLLIGGLLTWAFRQLAAANLALRARTEDLLRANRELTLAAKTSAMGAVAAHLMHELKTPVAGLEQLVAAQAELTASSEPGSALSAASELTQRLRSMINDAVGVMRDEQTGTHFELTAAEIVGLVAQKMESLATSRGVRLLIEGELPFALRARAANLALLVLKNLVQNAIEASPAGGVVRLGAVAEQRRCVIYVEDQGTGLPPTVRDRLFQPCVSSKQGGSGLGLALSQQLARQGGGKIELARSDAKGTRFHLVFDPES